MCDLHYQQPRTLASGVQNVHILIQGAFFIQKEITLQKNPLVFLN